jgi:two-component system, cell cycle response regulator
MDEVTQLLGRVFERERARTRLEADAERVRAKALLDELTSLLNRRGFLEQGPERLRSAHADGRSAALFFVDLDGMKHINDELGHEYGDRALVDTADLLRETFRGSDLLARLGGDEFAVLAVDDSIDELGSLATRLQGQMGIPNASRQRPYRLSASIGVALCHYDEPMTFKQLIARADALMYQQKRTGSGRPAVREPSPLRPRPIA